MGGIDFYAYLPTKTGYTAVVYGRGYVSEVTNSVCTFPDWGHLEIYSSSRTNFATLYSA